MSAALDQSLFSFHESIILTKNNTWLSNGEEITHPNTIIAFSRNIFRCPEGHEIRIGREKKTIHIEDTMYFVVALEGAPELGFSVRLNDGRQLELNPETLQYKPGRLTCKVYHPNEGTQEEAKFLTTAYYELLKYIEKNEFGFEITIEKKKIILSEE